MYEEIPEEHCLTLVRGISAPEFLTRIGAEPGETGVCWEDLLPELWPQEETDENIAVAELDGWILGFECIGSLGVNPSVYGPLSAGTELVSHFQNVNHVADFVWVQDGVRRLGFDPVHLRVSRGEPLPVFEELKRIGFHIDDADDEVPFSLAEHLTGIDVTAELLTTLDFHIGTVR
ncbi:DUF6461 domain-containing protein [Actinocorallia sp. B10E7]|uniref:DUF6461 domain-containing protein n=1 Tax=Actinocorallia sp. B10E7 TaxID=3153558 RepID=UPI00325CD0B1